MSKERRIAILERLTAAMDCTGACPRCCASHSLTPGRLTPSERAKELLELLDRAGLVFVADDVNAAVDAAEADLSALGITDLGGEPWR